MFFNKSHFLVSSTGQGWGGGEASPSLFLGDLVVVLELVCICVVVLLVKGGECIHKLSIAGLASLLRFSSLAVPTESWVGTWEQG